MSKQQLIETIHELDALGVLVQCDSDEHLIEALDEVLDDDND